MGNDDWIKFGCPFWASCNTRHKKHVLQLYEKAWRAKYNSDPILHNGSPVDFLHTPHYTCGRPVPWLPGVEARFTNSMLEPPPPSTMAAATEYIQPLHLCGNAA